MHSARFSSGLRALSGCGLLFASLLGCGGETTTPDASTPDAPPVDNAPADRPVAPDVPPAQSSIIYGPCRSDTECAVGLTCRTEADAGFSGGECNRTCTSHEDCVLIPKEGPAVDGYCAPAVGTAPRMCQRVCANGIDCERDGYTCRVYNPGTLSEVRACIHVCTPESCIEGTTCDADSGRCRPTDAMPAGRTLGQTCQPETRMGVPTPPREMLCRSNICQAEWNPDSRGNRFYSGWNGGYCLSRCILPEGYNSSTFWGPAGMIVALPQGTCPMGGICLPDGSTARGDLGLCLKECQTNADCRAAEGYFCQKTRQISATSTRRFSNGYCLPVNCLSTTTPATCPSGFMCRRNANGSGSCVPEMMATP